MLRWYELNSRPLPWREVPPDPYRVLISEFMCQQTQIKTVLPYFARWVSAFPTVESVASAEISTLMDLWQGLGYYRRAHNLAEVCRNIVNSGWPQSYLEWLRHPGVGSYTAAALASILHDEPTAVVDGNVARVFARVTACDEPPSRLRSTATKWANELIKGAPVPGTFNQALMEIGAQVCTPRNPKCATCPFAAYCIAYRDQTQLKFPQREKVSVPKAINMHALVIQSGGKVALTRSETNWWKGLWCLPMVKEPPIGTLLATLNHTVTNHRIALAIYIAEECESEVSWFCLENLPAMPAPHRRALGFLNYGPAR